MDTKSRFTKIIKENEGLIYKVTTLYTNSVQDRKDLYQEIVYQLWKSFDSFNEQAKLSTWMYRVALNTAIFNLKQTKRRIQTTSIDFRTEQPSEEIDKTEEERINLLYEHIQMLNLLEKGIILLYLEGKSHEEIASIVGISISNVGTKISRIREKIKSQIIKKK
ncbi:RNA polymerase sigma factor [Gillisia limnaea]|uniref:RNA polymerase, sigma-24 subunit, ECF subfamily n=1 Tax=Gillisia limnaea (strain DSM 15749 / LMG 21470 / R-8282) TaxID=865937 RepID=H2BSX3_GILLR|nr:sigma-70 family RNA polymerase sigma factor [Gillisia limnaea]EHQ01503.1 RNA polymerase, sigma-24 subunit, ECF subfamily [Gillisia limnaea DSM 15749]